MSSRSNSSLPTSMKSPSLQLIVTLLCVVSGSLDAISFLALGEAFASVMTGNVVFLGVAAGTFDTGLALYCGIAILGYIVGVIVGSWLAKHWERTNDDKVWPSRVTKVLALQLGLLLIASTIWVWLHGDLEGHLDIVFLAIAAGVMGIQSAAVRNIGVRVSTTYMTGALTTLLEALFTGRSFSQTETSAIGGLLSLAGGALLGSLALRFTKPVALLVPTVALGAVVVVLTVRGAARYRLQISK